MASESSSTPSKPAANYHTDPALYIYTSLTAGSSHIVTATSRLETILRANKIPFKAIDLATDDKARMLWGRRAGKDESGRVRKLPGLVQEGQVLGDLVEIEDWNEYGELKMHVKIYYDEFTQPSIHQKPKVPVQPPKPVHPIAAAVAAAASAASSAPKAAPAPAPKQAEPKTTTLPIRSIAEEAAQKAKEVKLQSLREKVYGKGGSAPKAEDKEKKEETTKAPAAATGKDGAKSSSESEEESSEEEDDSSPPSPIKAGAEISKARGLQSPTSSGWKGSSLNTVQSPTSTSWKPTDVDAPITTYHGSVVAAASAEEIAAIERAETIKEEEEEEDSEENSEEDSEEESSEEEEHQPKKEVKK